MKVAIIPNMTRSQAPQVTQAVCAQLDALHASYAIEQTLRADLAQTKAQFVPKERLLDGCDAVLAIGGDGTILHAAKLAAANGLPVLGINAGRLAFMAGLENNELALLGQLMHGQYTVDKRLLLKASIVHPDGATRQFYCLNDAVVSSDRERRIVTLCVLLDGKPLHTYRGDGLIVATPTGSTAYSLSAGGPVVDPGLESILLTPICAHSLYARSLLFCPAAVLQIQAASQRPLMLTCDGEAPLSVPAGGRVVVEKAEYCAEFISIKSDNFNYILNQKLTQWRE